MVTVSNTSIYRNDGDILPRVLTGLILSMMCIVQIGDGRAQRFYASGWTVLSSIHGNVNLLRPLKASYDIIVDLWSSLTQVCPSCGIIGETMLICSFRAPDYSSRGAGRIQASMWLMSLVGIAELPMYLGAHFAVQVSQGTTLRRVNAFGGTGPYLAPGALLTLNLRPEKLMAHKN